jgi:hypothetical protein
MERNYFWHGVMQGYEAAKVNFIDLINKTGWPLMDQPVFLFIA